MKFVREALFKHRIFIIENIIFCAYFVFISFYSRKNIINSLHEKKTTDNMVVGDGFIADDEE